MAHTPLTELVPKNVPDAVATKIGWAHPDTGEHLVSIRGLDNPVPYYRPNSRKKAFINPNAPKNTVRPTISGTATVGQTLTAANGTWTGTPAPTYTRQWKRAGVNISGATATTYVLQAADQGQVITVTVTATNSAGTASATSAGTAAVAAA
ncbi:hypothetical protein FDI24_gp133 [Acidovorax phage ACP17]|uniref:Uncharacterized protein n=1 Tax=Acidovorax phage ACP17 TaxID=2010329 RepID=A0A218M2Z6_9CAUD|nr:hypothetical protein FDI24_gp133 [Acidovorax phage ACP17]ASD50414.1 hypothetical protein [Acidovorax phage ACP17]